MPHRPSPPCQAERLSWTDPELGGIDLPKGRLELRAGFGSGLSTRKGDPPGTLWAVCDRGPNLKIADAAELYGLEWCRDYEGPKGAKIMPRLDIGPAIAELRIVQDRVELLRTIPLNGRGDEPLCGLPLPVGAHHECEPALDLDGQRLAPAPDGADTEGIAALPDGGGFWLSEEYGPSLLKVDGEGSVELRLVPEDMDLAGAACLVKAVLPALAGKRKLNRGFEAVGLSEGGKWLFLAFQSPLAHPDEAAHENGRHVRIWRLRADTGQVAAQYLYPLDPPDTFLRDAAKEDVKPSDVKVSELLCLGEELLVLERISETTKIYRVDCTPDFALPAGHLKIGTRPSVEEMSCSGTLALPVLAKQLLFNSDDAPQVAADLEGMALISPTELILVSDNDFGVTGGRTSFWRLRFSEPLY